MNTFHVSAELLPKIDAGAAWLVVDKESNTVLDAFNKRDEARAAKTNDAKLVQFQAGATELVVSETGEIKSEVSEVPEFTDTEDQQPVEPQVDPEPPVAVIDVQAPIPGQAPIAGAPAEEPVATDAKPAKVKAPKPDIRRKSEIEKPTRMVHTIADMLFDADPKVTRKEILEACKQSNIAYNTALTQYQAWRSNREAKVAEPETEGEEE